MCQGLTFFFWGQASSVGLIGIGLPSNSGYSCEHEHHLSFLYLARHIPATRSHNLCFGQQPLWDLDEPSQSLNNYHRLRHTCDMLNIAMLWDALQSYRVVISSERTESAISLRNYIPSRALMRFTTWVSDQTSKSEANFFCHSRNTAQQRLSETSTFWRYLANSQGGQHRKTMKSVRFSHSPSLFSLSHFPRFMQQSHIVMNTAQACRQTFKQIVSNLTATNQMERQTSIKKAKHIPKWPLCLFPSNAQRRSLEAHSWPQEIKLGRIDLLAMLRKGPSGSWSFDSCARCHVQCGWRWIFSKLCPHHNHGFDGFEMIWGLICSDP